MTTTVVTEAEADLRRCQESFGNGLTHTCFGHDCMAWRWWHPAEAPELTRGFEHVSYMGNRTIEQFVDDMRPQTLERPAGVPASWVLARGWGYLSTDCGWAEPEAEYEARQAKHAAEWPTKRKGYCGKAGHPDSAVVTDAE